MLVPLEMAQEDLHLINDLFLARSACHASAPKSPDRMSLARRSGLMAHGDTQASPGPQPFRLACGCLWPIGMHRVPVG
ncbi:MAG: hypothetical protein ACYCS1_11545 [Gammaproteobacteria bacterium]